MAHLEREVLRGARPVHVVGALQHEGALVVAHPEVARRRAGFPTPRHPRQGVLGHQPDWGEVPRHVLLIPVGPSRRPSPLQCPVGRHPRDTDVDPAPRAGCLGGDPGVVDLRGPTRVYSAMNGCVYSYWMSKVCSTL